MNFAAIGFRSVSATSSRGSPGTSRTARRSPAKPTVSEAELVRRLNAGGVPRVLAAVVVEATDARLHPPLVASRRVAGLTTIARLPPGAALRNAPHPGHSSARGSAGASARGSARRNHPPNSGGSANKNDSAGARKTSDDGAQTTCRLAPARDGAGSTRRWQPPAAGAATPAAGAATPAAGATAPAAGATAPAVVGVSGMKQEFVFSRSTAAGDSQARQEDKLGDGGSLHG